MLAQDPLVKDVPLKQALQSFKRSKQTVLLTLQLPFACHFYNAEHRALVVGVYKSIRCNLIREVENLLACGFSLLNTTGMNIHRTNSEI